jgi:succinate dehydrogenase / fumarate reductase cytochrome b subunit
MLTKNGHPVFLNLLLIKLPIAGLMSIAHRLSGVVMVVTIPLLLAMLERSLASPTGFEQIARLFHSSLGVDLLFVGLWALLHHLFAGLRYLLIDLELGLERPTFRVSAGLVLFLSPVVAGVLTWALLSGVCA